MSVNKQHIVIVTSEFPPQPGGIGNHAYNLALHLSQQDFDIHVLADQRSQTGKEEEVFDKQLPFNVTRIKRQDFRFKMYVNRVLLTRSKIKKASFIIATGKFSLWNVGFLSMFRTIPTIAVIHGTEVNFKSFFLRKSIDLALKQFNKIVAVSNYTKDLVAHLNKTIEVIPNGINLQDWQASHNTEVELQGQPVLTTVGRVSERKGQLNVIKQLPELIKKFPQLHYHCIGIPTQADTFMQEAKHLDVSNYITFHGSVDAQHLKNMLSKTDVFVMLSSEDKTGDVEGFGIAILEANALGVPAIGSKGCGIEDAINVNKSGELIDYHNATQFINALEQIMTHKKTYQVEAKLWAKHHDWSNIVKDYMRLMT